MTMHLEEQGSSSRIDVRSYEVTLSQIREDHHTYYRASAQPQGKIANAYGPSPEDALNKLYEEAIPRALGIVRNAKAESSFLPRWNQRAPASRVSLRR